MMLERLETSWFNLVTQYTSLENAKKEFSYLKKQYTGSNRHYHNFNHLSAMYNGLANCKTEIKDNEIILFSIWFHDVVYNAYKKNNEYKSAIKATEFLKNTSFNKERTAQISLFINATAQHELVIASNDLALFLDLDLSVLGSEREIYKEYTKKIRKEYQLIPSPMYKKGRKKILKQFKNKENLYFTKEFQEKYELKARENIAWEIEQL